MDARTDASACAYATTSVEPTTSAAESAMKNLRRYREVDRSEIAPAQWSPGGQPEDARWAAERGD